MWRTTVFIIALTLAVTQADTKKGYSSECSGKLTDTKGSFRSPFVKSHPDYYPDNTRCKWSIDVPYGCDVIISFHNFDTEACCDYVKITNDKGNLIGQFSGPRPNFNITVISSEAIRVDIVFSSDESTVKTGFHANYAIQGKCVVVPSVAPLPAATTVQVLGVGDSLMEAFLKMTTALSKIMKSAADNLQKNSDQGKISIFKSDLLEAIERIETLASVQSPALTSDQQEQLNYVLKHLNTASKLAGKKLKQRLHPSACLLPKKVGPCRAAFRKWYFDKFTKRCLPFIFGGCQKNANNFENETACKSLCVTPDSQCPDGRRPVNCFINPCDVTSCAAYTVSHCKANYCGGCNAEFSDQHGHNITNSCHCPKNQKPVKCNGRPCDSATCPAHPTAKCRVTRCSLPCVTEFVDENGNVIKNCTVSGV